jgi:hypothetical protein
VREGGEVIKRCFDCEHYCDVAPRGLDFCTHKDNASVVYKYNKCLDERSDSGNCGKEGKHWEKR